MPALEVADIFRRHGEAYRQEHAGHLGRVERRIMAAIEACRTAQLGGHVERCTECDLLRIAYNSCRNRHCPKCQGGARATWLAERQAELLPVPYFHVVFTLPSAAAGIAFQNKAAVYAILFKAAAETLSTIAADRRHLGAEIGFVAVLHTWGQNLQHHPHIHCLIPGGGLSPDGMRWASCRPGFFLPVRVLSRLFRRLFLDKLRAAFDSGRLAFFGTLAELAGAAAFTRCVAELRRIEWVVYAKPPFAGPAAVLAYLGRYTHRVAVANNRLVSLAGGRVSFRWRDYRHPNKNKIMTLAADEFIRRFLLHALPGGFHRIRHYGFLANGRRTDKLALCRTLLAVADAAAPLDSQKRRHLADTPHRVCPCCVGGWSQYRYRGWQTLRPGTTVHDCGFMADDHCIGGSDRDGDSDGEFLRRLRRPRRACAVYVLGSRARAMSRAGWLSRCRRSSFAARVRAKMRERRQTNGRRA